MIKINLLPREEKKDELDLLLEAAGMLRSKDLEERFRLYKEEVRVQRKDAPELKTGDKLYSFYFRSGKFIGRFRRGPIHGINKKHWINGFRYPKTAQELRMNDAHVGYTRGKRRKKHLPTAWDDKYRSDQKWEAGVSWKRRTKSRHQWGGSNERIAEKIEE